MTLEANKQLRHVFAVVSGATPDSRNPDYWDGDVPWATPEDLSSLDGYWLRKTRRRITSAGYKSCSTTAAPANSVVLTKRAPIGHVALLADRACSNQGCFLLVPRQETDTRFYYYWFSLQTHYLRVLGRGSTFMELSAAELKSLNVPHPPLQLQRAIAQYLDRKTEELDALVAAKERLLALLKRKRRATITHAVTRGLDPSVSFQDSGVPWLGEIPAHWALNRLKHLGRTIIGLTFEPADTVTDGSGVLVLRASNVRDQSVVLDDKLFVNMEIPDLLRTKVHDLLICSRSGSRDLIGKTALIDESTAGLTFGTFMTVYRSTHNEYLFYVLNSPLFDYQAGTFSTSTINQLTVETLNGMEVPIPPPCEQKAIVNYLRKRTSRVDRLAKATHRTIALLRERRNALISAAVTGRLDARALS